MEIFAHEEANVTENFDKQYARLKIDLTSLDVDETNESLVYGPGMILMTGDSKWAKKCQIDFCDRSLSRCL